MSTTYPKQSTFKRNAHISYFKRCLRALPSAAEGHDSNRITIAFFCLSALDLLGALDEPEPGWIDWVWSLQAPTGGFRGSTFDPSSPGHLPSTYTALLVLGLLRAPLAQLDVGGLRRFLSSCRLGSGAYAPLPVAGAGGDGGAAGEAGPGAGQGDDGGAGSGRAEAEAESEFDFQADARMSYCAAVISDMLRGPREQCGSETGTGTKDMREPDSGADSAEFLAACRTWEGGYASKPGMIEAQGGTTYCAIAALTLLGRPISYTDADAVIRWGTQRQLGGFQGRPGKLEDVCYSFWIGATLKILNPSVTPDPADRAFLLSAQSPIGGFGKDPDDMPDPYHAYLALAALALHGSEGEGLKPLDPLWNVSKDTAAWLRHEIATIHVQPH